MTNSRQKGKRGELLWRDVLRATGWTEARRGQQYAGSPDSPDVVGGPKGWHPEVKFRTVLNVHGALKQAEDEMPAGNRPYVAWKKNNKDWVVVLRAGDFLELLHAIELRKETDA